MDLWHKLGETFLFTAAPTVQFVTTTASCREPKKERDRSRQVLKRVCCFEVERIGASSSLLEIGVITRNGTAIGE